MKLKAALRSALLFALLLPAWAIGANAPIPVKVVIVTTFEADYDNPKATGDTPGEALAWIKGLHLDTVLPLPAGTFIQRTSSQEFAHSESGFLRLGMQNSLFVTRDTNVDFRCDALRALWSWHGALSFLGGSRGAALSEMRNQFSE